MTSPWQVEWFTRTDGERHISGWTMTALDGRRVGICPVCGAYVPAGTGLGELDLVWMHERWHARTDFPDPDGTS